MGEDSLALHNQHSASCGHLPEWAVNRPLGTYFGYYENEYGEQWLMVASVERVRLAGGDCGWDSTFDLLGPPWEEIRERRFPGWPTLNMIPHERSWLESCLAAAALKYSLPADPKKRG